MSMTVVDRPVTAEDSRAKARIYSPSWVDLLTDRIARLPIPAWLFYAGLFGVGHAITTVLKWFDGREPMGTLLTTPVPVVVWFVYLLAMLHYLDGVARDKLRAFRPLLDIDEAAYARLEYELTHAPARSALASGFGWMVVAIAVAISSAPMIRQAGYPLWEIIATAACYMLGGAAIYDTKHQLQIVSHIHAQARRIDLLQPEPVYAFSGLTARTAVAWIFLLYITLLLVPGSLTLSPVTASMLMPLALAVIAFAWPLWGMHRRLVAEKQRLQAAANEHLKIATGELHKRIAARELQGIDMLSSAIAGLCAERQVIDTLPTWPWRPSTLSGLFTALLLPIALWILQQALARWLGL